jgi:hypothetical protein
MSLYDRVLARPGGDRALAVSRLKRAILTSLHDAFAMSGIESQSDLARRLRIRRSAVNQVFLGDGNVRISTLAEYLYEMGFELDVALVRAGEPRAAALEGRNSQQVTPDGAPSSASVFQFSRGSQTFTETQTFAPEPPAMPSMMVRVTTGTEPQNPIIVSSWYAENAQEGVRSASVATPIRIDGPGDAR